MTDIVERLRERGNDTFIRDYPLMREAADEIERLQAQEKRLYEYIYYHLQRCSPEDVGGLQDKLDRLQEQKIQP